MQIERKFVSLSDFKASEDGPGTLEGYASVFGVLDEGGDIITKGAFADTLPEFLSSGFTAHSHDWSVDGLIGFPVEAREDSHGLWVKSQFHSTPDAQAVRVKAKERMDAGKQVGLSIGYQVASAPTVIQPKDYEKELSKYVPVDALAETLQKAKRFPRVRVLTKLNNFEYSIVTAPMNQKAQAVSVKDGFASGGFVGQRGPEVHFHVKETVTQSQIARTVAEALSGRRPANTETDVKEAPTVNVKGLFEDELAERTNSLWALNEVLMCVLYEIKWAVQSATQAGLTVDGAALIHEAITEFEARVIALLGDETSSAASELAYSGVLKSVEGAASVPLDLRSEAVVSAAEEFARRGAVLAKAVDSLNEHGSQKLDVRKKEGRTLSSATLNRMKAAREAMQGACDHLDELMSAAEPKGLDEATVANVLAEVFTIQAETRRRLGA